MIRMEIADRFAKESGLVDGGVKLLGTAAKAGPPVGNWMARNPRKTLGGLMGGSALAGHALTSTAPATSTTVNNFGKMASTSSGVGNWVRNKLINAGRGIGGAVTSGGNAIAEAKAAASNAANLASNRVGQEVRGFTGAPIPQSQALVPYTGGARADSARMRQAAAASGGGGASGPTINVPTGGFTGGTGAWDTTRTFARNHPVALGAGGLALAGGGAYAMSGPNEEERYQTKQGQDESGIPIGKFLTPTQLHTIKTAGLHKVVAAVEKVASGRNVGEITIDTAVHLLGEKAFIKRAETRRITMGLAALGKVTEA